MQASSTSIYRWVRHLVFVILAVFSLPALPQTIVTAVVGDLAARDIIKRAGDQVNSSINLAEQTGNGLISKSASELSVLTKGAGLVVGDNIDKATRSLGVDEQNLLGRIYSLTQSLAQMQGTIFDLKDTAVIDFANLSEVVPFKKLPFFIQRIDGIAQVISEGEYHMRVLAYGLTPGTEGKSSALSLVTIKQGRELTITTRISISGAGVADIFIPSRELIAYFNESRPVILPIELRMTVTEKKGFIFKKDSLTTISAPVGLALYPQRAGTVTVTAKYPVYGWVKATCPPDKTCPRESKRERAGDGERSSMLTQEIRVAGGLSNPKPGAQHLENAEWHCWAWFSGRADVCGEQAWWRFASRPSITEDGTYASWGVNFGGESREWWLSADVYNYVVTGEGSDSKPYPIYWNKSAVFELPEGYTHVSIDGSTITKQPISLVEFTSMPGFMTYVNVSPAPTPKVSYSIGAPLF